MFIGHYGPVGIAAKGQFKLWQGFLAVQLLDILWAPLVILGIEQVRIVPEFTQSNHFDLHHMPYSHSLVMALFWSAASGLAYWGLQRRKQVVSAIVFATLVFSHWVFDFLTHIPDLPIWFAGPKVGLGLWENRPLSFLLEILLFAAGLLYFLFKTSSRSVWGRISGAALIATAIGLQVIGNWGPPPENPSVAAASALFSYGLFIVLAYWVDCTRAVSAKV